MGYIGYFLIMVLFAVATGGLGMSKSRSWTRWFLIGLLTGPIGLKDWLPDRGALRDCKERYRTGPSGIGPSNPPMWWSRTGRTGQRTGCKAPSPRWPHCRCGR